MSKQKYIWFLSSMIGLIALIIVGIVLFQEPPKKKEKVTHPKHHKPTYRATYHFTAPDQWMNDPQRPIYLDGKYHYYYLYNRDYPNGNGTEWRHATSKDLVHWKDEGIAIPKYTNKNGDPWTGSFVVDQNNTAGFGKGAFIAIVTQPSADGGKQEQYLWYSTDKGKSFKSYRDDPVMPNPGTKDFRDPKIIWDAQESKWVLLMAEGSKIGFYESRNLKDWRYTGAFTTQNIGIVECPDLYQMKTNDGTYKWILGVSANGKSIGKPNTYAYWIGDFTGSGFNTDQTVPKWLDHGFDWYGGVTFESGKKSEKFTKRYAIAWMNNWDYPNETPTRVEGFNGFNSVVRQIQLKQVGSHDYSLVSQPISSLKKLTYRTDSFDEIKVKGSKTLRASGDAYQLDTDISWSEAKNIGIRLRESKDKLRHIDVGIFPQGGYSYVNRGSTDQPDKSHKYVESRAAFDKNKHNVHLKILVDKTSIEVFIDDGQVVHSSEVFAPLEDRGISLFSDDGTAVFKNVKIQHFDSIKEN
ncbi:glycoside hydrolase family 32 protein [Terrilactibacillus laevilacticus]|uniref:Glycoside hydrolase family 32 protein n=1 Tax=Terrilactibacillus laevilacticus TaxID=1380157 RepID=A0ABW5PN25_9BACI